MLRPHPGWSLLAAGFLLTTGCTSSPWATSSTTAPVAAAPAAIAPGGAQAQPPSGPISPMEAAANPAAGSLSGGLAGSPAPPIDPRAVDALVSQIAQVERLDAAAQERLAQDVRQTDPALWPLLAQYFRASLAYRQQADQRAAAAAASDRPEQAAPPQLAAPPLAAAIPARELPGRPPDAEPAAERPPARRPEPEPAPGPRATAERSTAERPAADRPDRAPPRADREQAGPRRDGSGSGRDDTGLERVVTRSRRDGSKSVPEIPRTEVAKPGSGVVAASYEGLAREGWRDRLAAAIAALEAEAHEAPRSPLETDLQTRLRLLYLAGNRREDALRPIASAPPAVQEFWSQEIYGLATWLDAERITDTARRASEAKVQLAGAANRLGELAPLVIRNLAFITEVKSYGDVKPFEKYEFVRDQQVMLYAEIENFKSEETSKGFHTVLGGNYQIFDSRGQRVVQQDLKTIEEHCRNARRDFFVEYLLRIPKRLNPGKYTLQLTLDDVKGQKVAQSSIDFTIRDSDK